MKNTVAMRALIAGILVLISMSISLSSSSSMRLHSISNTKGRTQEVTGISRDDDEDLCVVSAANDGPNFGWPQFWATTKALQNAVAFFDASADKANVDALIATRIAEGQMKVLYSHLKETTRAISSKTLRRAVAVTRKLLKKLGEVAEKILASVAVTEPEYLSAMLPVVQENTWDKLDYPSQDLQVAPSEADTSRPIAVDRGADTFKEKESDMCLKEVVGTASHGVGKKCRISKQCWAFMTSPDRTGYSLTHEVLYLQVGEMFGCERQMRKLAKKTYGKDLNEMKQAFCSAIYREVLSEAQHCFPEHLRDLFMEQVTLCGIYGFRTFFRDGWLQKILSWQRPNGCYSFRYPNTSKYDFRTLNPNSVDYFQQQPQYPSSGDMNQVIDDEQAQIDSIREALLDSEQRQQIFDLTAEESKQSVPPTEVTHQSPSELILPTADEGQNLQALLQDFRQQYEYKPSLLEPNEFQGASQGGVRTDEGSSSSSGETAYGVRVYSPEDRREFRENMRSKLGLPDKFNTTLTQLTHIVAHKDRRSSSSTSTSLGVPQQQQQNHHHHRWYHVAASGGRRAKREETLMDEGCMSHATALGVDSLSLHLRYILEDIYANDLMK